MCLWLNVPLFESCPARRTETPSQRSDPKLSISAVAQSMAPPDFFASSHFVSLGGGGSVSGVLQKSSITFFKTSRLTLVSQALFSLRGEGVSFFLPFIFALSKAALSFSLN